MRDQAKTKPICRPKRKSRRQLPAHLNIFEPPIEGAATGLTPIVLREVAPIGWPYSLLPSRSTIFDSSPVVQMLLART
jgi:hypothetical protein